MIRSVAAMLAIAFIVATPASAQVLPSETSASSQAEEPPARGAAFLSRFAFGAGIERIFAADDPRFEWDAKWGAELDLIDYGPGALTFGAAYEVLLGDEFREFDPNQGNYTLGGSASIDAGPVELAGVFHHVSRHLSDRPKRSAVDWNMMGGRVRTGFARGRTAVQGRMDIRGVVAKSFVDYEWEVDAEARALVRMTPRTALVGLGALRVVGVDGSRGRGNQHGWRADGAIRFDGSAAALELFAAVERRIDPYQLEFSTLTWLTTGFRLGSR